MILQQRYLERSYALIGDLHNFDMNYLVFFFFSAKDDGSFTEAFHYQTSPPKTSWAK